MTIDDKKNHKMDTNFFCNTNFCGCGLFDIHHYEFRPKNYARKSR